MYWWKFHSSQSGQATYQKYFPLLMVDIIDQDRWFLTEQFVIVHVAHFQKSVN